MATTKSTNPLPAALVKTKVEGQRLVTPLEAEVKALRVSDDETHAIADGLLGGIKSARKLWELKMKGTPTAPGPLALAQKTVSALQELNREIDGPLAALELQVKAKLQTYIRDREARLAEEQRLRDAEEAERLRKLEEVSQREQNARTKQMRERLAKQREELEQEAEEAAAEPQPEVFEGESSQVRKIRKWRFRDDGSTGEEVTGIPNGFREFVLAVCGHETPNPRLTNRTPPWDCLIPNRAYIERMFREQPDLVAGWPGIEVYEDIQIAGRATR